MSETESLPLELDAREILRYLNELGIRNVSGEALRDFITDLKKLIIYDLRYKSSISSNAHEVQGPERLHSASTFCSRIRSRRRDQQVGSCRRDCYRREGIGRHVASAPILREKENISPPQRRACSCTRVETQNKQSVPKRSVLTSTTSSNLIKVPVALPPKKADPVSLYHYYLSMWDKYKNNVPGENSWAELRWSIRQKLVTEVHKPMLKKVIPRTAKDLEKRRQGWVE